MLASLKLLPGSTDGAARRKGLGFAFGVLIAIFVFFSTFAADAADSAAKTVEPPPKEIERQMLVEAPAILKQLREKGYHNVAILKFRIEKGDQPVDRVGTLNMNLAERLEMALILKNDARNPINIVHDASAVAAKTPGADHRSPAGLKKLFAAKYPVAWGKQQVSPDVFLIGAAKIDDKLNELRISVFAYDSKSSNPQKICQFTAKPTVEELAESGESFVLRGIFDQGSIQLAQADRANHAEREATGDIEKIKESHSAELPKEHPLAPGNPDAPIGLKIYYDKQLVNYEFSDGCAKIPEPQEGQKVRLVLNYKAKDHARYGVVLKVNGENTIGHQRLNDFECHKWVLGPSDPPITVQGYQVDGQPVAEEFRVLSQHESQARAIDYGRDVGTISVVVYRQRAGEAAPPALPPTPDDEDLAILKRGVFPPGVPANFVALQQQLRSADTHSELRGLVVNGKAIDNPTVKVEFNTDPIPVMSGVITYYHR
jgi:hypothetical protein